MSKDLCNQNFCFYTSDCSSSLTLRLSKGNYQEYTTSDAFSSSGISNHEDHSFQIKTKLDFCAFSFPTRSV